MPLLFSYGTLQQSSVQFATFGRYLDGVRDSLPGHAVAAVASNGREHANVISTDARGAVVDGTVFEVTDDELARADAYEAPDGYARVEVTLHSGRRAWVYVFAGAHQPISTERSMRVRAASVDDLAALTRIWFEGWHDAHDAIVPPSLAALRTWSNFFGRLATELDAVRVIVEDGVPAGFAMMRGAEVFQFYVDRAARGSGAAALLMLDTEEQMAAAGIPVAWLACAVGNARAARFYEKCGWMRAATLTIESETSIGPFPIEVWRYEKSLR